MLFAVLTGVMALGVWTSVSAAEAFPATQLTNNNYLDYSCGVSGNRVVWTGEDSSGDSEVYTWTPSGGTVQVTNNSVPDVARAVSGDRVVWESYDVSEFEIYTWTPTGGTVRLTNNSYNDHSPEVSGDRVVWQGTDGSDYEIYTWTPTGGVVKVTSNSINDNYPELSGDRLVWQRGDGSASEVYTWTPTGGAVRLTNNSYEDDSPQVSGDRVVWQGSDGSDYQIYTWTPAGGTAQLTNGEWDFYPEVSGDRIVWERWDQTSEYWDSEIYTWTPAGGVVRVTNNDYEDVYAEVSGARIAWTQEVCVYEPFDSGSVPEKARLLDAEDTRLMMSERPSTLEAAGLMRPAVMGVALESSAFTWTPTGGAVRVASYAAGASVDGNRLAWDSFDPNYVQDPEIFTSVAHTRFDDKSARITYLPGWSRWDNSNYWAAFQDTYAYTDKKGDKVIVTFNGTSAAVVACTSNTKGKAQVSLYNGAAEPANLVSSSTVDLYSSTTKWKQRVYSTGTIAAGTHTLVIECLYQKRAASGWYTIDVDGFDILGTLEQSPTVTKIDDKDYAHFTYSPGIATGASTTEWSRWDGSGYYAASDDTYAYTDQVGYQAGFTFDGGYAAWVACTSNTKGKALVKLYAGTVDPGNLVSTTEVDLYSSTTKWKQKVYDTGILTPGHHTVVIECLGTKNPSSWYHTIDVDRFDVMLAP